MVWCLLSWCSGHLGVTRLSPADSVGAQPPFTLAPPWGFKVLCSHSLRSLSCFSANSWSSGERGSLHWCQQWPSFSQLKHLPLRYSLISAACLSPIRNPLLYHLFRMSSSLRKVEAGVGSGTASWGSASSWVRQTVYLSALLLAVLYGCSRHMVAQRVSVAAHTKQHWVTGKSWTPCIGSPAHPECEWHGDHHSHQSSWHYL